MVFEKESSRQSTPSFLVYARFRDLRHASESKRRDNLQPYIAALLIAAAQAQRIHYKLVAGEAISVYVLLLCDAKRRPFCLDLYEAHIPSTTLDRIDNPSVAFKSEPFCVKWYHLPCQTTPDAIKAIHHAISLAFL